MNFFSLSFCFTHTHTVTEGSYPAVQVTSDPADTISLVSVSPHSDLVAVATKQGKLSVWNISGSFCILVSCHGNPRRSPMVIVL